jgi:predicted O-linked N-acetylglucosamine transferase (SPINDLY family)
MDDQTLEKSLATARAHLQAGRLQPAGTAFREILARHPNHADSLQSLSIVLAQQNRLDEAIPLIQRAIELNPQSAVYQNNLGLMQLNSGMRDEAIATFRKAIALRPEYANAFCNLGMALALNYQIDEAIVAYKQSLSLQPNQIQALLNLATALCTPDHKEECLEICRRMLDLRPDYAPAHCVLGDVLQLSAKWDEALAEYQTAIELRPQFAQPYWASGIILRDTGKLDEALAAFRKAIEISPNYAPARSSLAFAVYFHPHYDALAILNEQKQWCDWATRQIPSAGANHDNDPSPDRPLRIGYVSADFRHHPVGRFLLPLFDHHDAKNFEIICYSGPIRPDYITKRLRDKSKIWREVARMDDASLAKQIREDKIDILIDLSLQTPGNRLLVFARKPAPVQATYLAYVGTSGLPAMDYRLTDIYLDPIGEDESAYSERSIRLPRNYWCYEPYPEMPAVNPLPALQTGRITFGCLNSCTKNSTAVWQTWRKLLAATPNSRLMVSSPPGSHSDRIRGEFQSAGVDPNRLFFVEQMPIAQYFQQYHEIDIALDPFPYGGGTTSCDAIWMGVPIVTLRGRTAVGRGGASILSNLDIPQFIAENEDDYVKIAANLAADLPALSKLRAGLRQRMKESPLMDAAQFAKDVEAVYRQMWRNWCSTQK